MQIIRLNHDNIEWQNLLKTTDHKIYHTPFYKEFIEAVFGVESCYIGVVDEGKLQSLLPCFAVKHSLFGKRLISTPYLEYGGFIGESKFYPEMLKYLKEQFPRMQYLELRGEQQGPPENLTRANHYKRFILDLTTEEEVWKNIQKSKRKAINKAARMDVFVRDLRTEEINKLYRLYLQNMRDFGSPPFSRKYFIEMFKLTEKGYAKILGGYYDDKLISLLTGFCYNGTVHINIAVSDPKYREYRSNDAVHWHFIKWALENDYKMFDFGRVREDSGQFEYKRKWGAKLEELPHYYALWNVKEPPVIDPENSKYRLIIAVWRKLPLFVTCWIGPWLRKGLGI